VEGTDYEQRDGHCWYNLTKFRAAFPEYKDVSDDVLTNDPYKKIGVFPVDHSGFKELRQDELIAVGCPLLVLVMGWALLWRSPGSESRRDSEEPGAAIW
jgi:hypothetical protein